jgi:hypothetical protein
MTRNHLSLFRSSARTLTLCVSLLATAAGRGEDWPQWRGPNRDGLWRETGILAAIPEAGLKIRWRARIGAGYSGPVVAQGRVFVADHQLRPEVERVLCFDEASGKPIWVHSYPCAYEDMEYGNGPRASPVVHEGKVYTLGTKGHLLCLNADKGTVLWSKDLAKDCNARIPQYGARRRCVWIRTGPRSPIGRPGIKPLIRKPAFETGPWPCNWLANFVPRPATGRLATSILWLRHMPKSAALTTPKRPPARHSDWLLLPRTMSWLKRSKNAWPNTSAGNPIAAVS